jgi:CPA2 family monovalent cation:H+ antiporter-2
MLLVGKRVIPRLMHYVAHTGSRELFRLGVLAIALGIAYLAAVLFGVSFALGAFFAGMILSESELSQRAATESLPLRDAFAGGNDALPPHRHFQRNSPELVHVDDKFQAPQRR